MAIFGAGFGVAFPCLASIVADATPEGSRGKAFGVYYAVYSLGVVIGGVSSGLLEDGLGGSTTAPFLLGMLVVVVAVPLTYVIDSFGRTRNRSRGDKPLAGYSDGGKG